MILLKIRVEFCAEGYMRPLVYIIGGVLIVGFYFHLGNLNYPLKNTGGRMPPLLASSSDGGTGGLPKLAVGPKSGFGTNPTQVPEPRRVNTYPIPKRIDMGHIEGKGIGYERGYSKLSVIFGPEYEVGHSLSLFDVRAVVFDDGSLAANLGVITRILPKKFCEVFGANLFYDFREGKYGNFNQISGGFEMLHRRWEMHANARVPLAITSHKKKCVFNDYVGPYREECKTRQYAEYAFDMDVGYYFVKGKAFQLFAGAGPYYLCGHATTFGGKAWLRPQFSDYVSFELSASYDSIYQTIFQANVVLTIPLYRYSPALRNKTGPCNITNRQIYQPIDRDIVLLNGKFRCQNNW